jgi:hypothetical protein
MRIVQILPAPTGWFQVHHVRGAAQFDPIAFWALCEDKEGDTFVMAVTAVDFNDVRPGVFRPYTTEGATNFVGIMGPGETKEEWEELAKQKAAEDAPAKKQPSPPAG